MYLEKPEPVVSPIVVQDMFVDNDLQVEDDGFDLETVEVDDDPWHEEDDLLPIMTMGKHIS